MTYVQKSLGNKHYYVFDILIIRSNVSIDNKFLSKCEYNFKYELDRSRRISRYKYMYQLNNITM